MMHGSSHPVIYDPDHKSSIFDTRNRRPRKLHMLTHHQYGNNDKLNDNDNRNLLTCKSERTSKLLAE